MVIPLSLFEEYLYSSNHRSGSAVYLYSASGSGEAEESLNFGAGQVKLPYTYCNFNPEHLNRLSAVQSLCWRIPEPSFPTQKAF